MVEAVNYRDLHNFLSMSDCSVELSSLESEKNRPAPFNDEPLLADLSDLDVRKFVQSYHIKKGRSGIVYIAGLDGSEAPFVIQGFIGRCLVVGPHVISRMRHRLWALQHRIELVALDSDRFTTSLTAIRKIYAIMESFSGFNTFLPFNKSTIGGDLESIVASTPLLNPVDANDSRSVPIPHELDPDGILREYVMKNTRTYTEDNQIAVMDCELASDDCAPSTTFTDPEALRIGQLVEMLITFRGYPTKRGRIAFAAHLEAVRVVSRSPTLRLIEIVEAAKGIPAESDDDANFVPKKKIRFDRGTKKTKSLPKPTGISSTGVVQPFTFVSKPINSNWRSVSDPDTAMMDEESLSNDFERLGKPDDTDDIDPNDSVSNA